MFDQDALLTGVASLGHAQKRVITDASELTSPSKLESAHMKQAQAVIDGSPPAPTS